MAARLAMVIAEFTHVVEYFVVSTARGFDVEALHGGKNPKRKLPPQIHVAALKYLFK